MAACARFTARWHVRARAELHLVARRGRFATSLEDAVLSANYVRASLKDVMSAPFGDRVCMHEALFDDRWLKDTGLTTLDFAKAMIDEGFDPMTVYFPLIVHGAMLIEPTESESKAGFDRFIMTLRDLTFGAKAGERERFLPAPVYAPRRGLDETSVPHRSLPNLRQTFAVAFQCSQKCAGDAAGRNSRRRSVADVDPQPLLFGRPLT